MLNCKLLLAEQRPQRGLGGLDGGPVHDTGLEALPGRGALQHAVVLPGAAVAGAGRCRSRSRARCRSRCRSIILVRHILGRDGVTRSGGGVPTTSSCCCSLCLSRVLSGAGGCCCTRCCCFYCSCRSCSFKTLTLCVEMVFAKFPNVL